MKKLMQQIMKFGAVGFLCFFIDYAVMIALTELVGISYLIASGISFTVSVVVNYILSVTLVFETDKNANKGTEFVLFIVFSTIGLGLNTFIMWATVEKLLLDYRLGKILATGIVMVYNFITRKLFLEKKTTS